MSTWWARFLSWFRPGPTRHPGRVGPIEPFSANDLAARHNAERSKHALPSLLMDNLLNVEAQARASHAAAVDLTAPHLHDGFAPRPGDVWAGENAAKGQVDAGQVMGCWMGSEGHRRNVLDPEATRMGCGRATSAGGTTYWYCVFGA